MPEPQDFRTLLGRLIPALTVAGPDSPEVTALAKTARTNFPDRTVQIDALVATWRDLATPAGTPLTTLTGTNTISVPPARGGTVLGHVVTLAIGAAIASLGFNWEAVRAYIDPRITDSSSLWLLLTAAGGGGLGALVNAYFTGSASILPQTRNITRTLPSGVEQNLPVWVPGLITSVLGGAVAALTSVGLPMQFQSTTAPTTTYTTSFIAAALVGLFSSRAITGYRDKNLLLATMQQATASPPNLALADLLGTATSALDAVKLVSGTAPARPERPTASAPVTTSGGVSVAAR